ncbi:MAG: hypothetical protein EZS28_045483, partial [Streblomastix strix]
MALIQDNANDVIYPPEDGTGDPIDIQGDPQSEQEATFGIKDISWMDYKDKKYGMLTSNDRRIFTGVGGRQNKAFPMEIKIEGVPIIDEPGADIDKEIIIDQPDQPSGSAVPIWVTVLIIISVLSLLSCLILNALCCLLCPCCLCFKCLNNNEKRIAKISDDFEKMKIEHQKNLREIQLRTDQYDGFNNNQARISNIDKLIKDEKNLFSHTSYHGFITLETEINQDSTKGYNPNPNYSSSHNKSLDNHQTVLVPYEQNGSILRKSTANSRDVGMTQFAKQSQQEGSNHSQSSLFNRPEGKLGPTQSSTGDGQILLSYTKNLKNRLDIIEKQNEIQQYTNCQLTRKNISDFMECPKIEKGTLNEKIADFFSQAKPTTIDFSALPFDDPQLYGINWGASGPPVTIGLGVKGVQKAPKEILALQQRQERLLSKSSTNYSTPVARKSS